MQVIYCSSEDNGNLDEASDKKSEGSIELEPLVGTHSFLEIYDLKEAVNRGILQRRSLKVPDGRLQKLLARFWRVKLVTDNLDTMCPNISLNIGGQKSSDLERWSLAIFGILLQLSVIVFAGFEVLFSETPSLDFWKEKEPPPRYAFPLMAGGIATLILGMFLCAHVIDTSTADESWVVPGHEKRHLRLAWLQKGMLLRVI